MLSKHPNPEREEPAISPALSRRRDHMLGSDPTRHLEPRLVPSGDVQPSFLPESEFDDESEPDIPPPPASAKPFSAADGVERSVRTSQRPKLWPMAAAGASVLALGALTWVAYNSMMDRSDPGDVPFVAAEPGPEKIPPQQEGGIDVPNQDMRVYNELNGSAPAQETEVLLPAPEAPVAPPVAESEPQTTTATTEIPEVAAPPLDVEPAAGTGVQPTVAVAPSTESAGVPPATEATDSAPAPTEPVQTAAINGGFRIQLAAVKSRDAAQAAWKKMAKSHADVLNGLALNIVKVDRGDGALYRVQGGPFADRGAAETACGQLKQKSQDCLVIAP